MTTSDHIKSAETFIADGYVHITSVLTKKEVAHFNALRDVAVRDWCFVTGTTVIPTAVGSLLERFTIPVFSVMTQPSLLGLAESLMGPMVQLDSVVLNADPTAAAEAHRGPVCWHRDRLGFFPLGIYTRPLSVVVLIYLQDMCDSVGPLRVIPGSHRKPVTIHQDAVTHPHAHETLIRAAAGDAVMVHHNLLHSGTHNTSGVERRFLGFTYNVAGCVQEDNFNGPNCQALTATARRVHDRRTLRLLGADSVALARQNSGFLAPSDADWAAWSWQDAAYEREALADSEVVLSARAALR